MTNNTNRDLYTSIVYGGGGSGGGSGGGVTTGSVSSTYSVPISGSTLNTSTSASVIIIGDLLSRIEKIEKQLSILRPNIELHDKYPALKQAYEDYKIIERLIDDSK